MINECWDIEWVGEETKNITISIPTNTIYYEIEDYEVKEFYIY